MVVSDWGSINDRVNLIVADTDLEIPGPSLSKSVFDYNVLQTIKSHFTNYDDTDNTGTDTNTNRNNSLEELLHTNNEEIGDDCGSHDVIINEYDEITNIID